MSLEYKVRYMDAPFGPLSTLNEPSVSCPTDLIGRSNLRALQARSTTYTRRSATVRRHTRSDQRAVCTHHCAAVCCLRSCRQQPLNRRCVAQPLQPRPVVSVAVLACCHRRRRAGSLCCQLWSATAAAEAALLGPRGRRLSVVVVACCSLDASPSISPMHTCRPGVHHSSEAEEKTQAGSAV